MSGVGLEVLLEGLVPEIAYSGEKGVSIIELLKIVRKYHLSLEGHDVSSQGDAANGLQGQVDDADLEKSLSAAEMSSARWAWDWLRSRPQILINGNRRWNRLELSEALALPEASSIDPALVSAPAKTTASDKTKGKKLKKMLTTRPRIHPAEDLVWQTLTRHGVDYKRVPALEWACLQGVASARAEGILQSDLRRLVDQDKRSLPKRTDSLARKGYIAKRTVVVQKMKTSRLWLIDFAPPLVEAETCGLDLTPETLSKDLEPVPWHQRWTGNNIDMDALGRTVVGVVKAFNVIRYADMRLKMGVSGKRWQMKTLAKNCQRLVDIGVLKYTAASFPGSRKVFKDCLKFMRDPSAEEWDKFLATGKKTSQYSDPSRHRVPKPNALALYGKSNDDGQGGGDARAKLKRIFSGWTPEKPLAQTVLEVIRSAGPEGASNPQVSVATVGYQHRRYLSSYLTKVAETQQPPHLKKFQVLSKLVRTGKTSAYMFSALESTEQAALPQIEEEAEPAKEQAPAEGSAPAAPANPYGFGAVRPKAFATGPDISLSEMSRIARKSKPSSKRKLLPRIRPEHIAAAEPAIAATPEQDGAAAAEQAQPVEPEFEQPQNDEVQEKAESVEVAKDGQAETSGAQEQAATASTEVNGVPKVPTLEDLVMTVRYNGVVGKLQVHCSDRHLSFLRSGRGLKKPVIIPVNDNLIDPVIQDGEEKSLTISTEEKEGTPAVTHVFIFDSESQENANFIQQEVINMKSPSYTEPAAAPVEPTPAEETAKGRGGARGKGRGKGKKGQPLSASAKPFVCSLCGGAWKNDLGLKYHLQKAQVPCNPSFDPAILLERSRKRRKASPAPISSVNSEVGDEDATGRTRTSKRKADKKVPRFQPKVRTAMRTLEDPAHKFRGLDFTAAESEETPASWFPERPKGALKLATGFGSGAKSVLPESYQNGLEAGSFSNVDLRPATLVIGTQCTEPMLGIEKSTSRSVTVGAPDMGSGRVWSKSLPPSLPPAPVTPSKPRASDISPTPSGAFGNKTTSHATLQDFTLRPTNGSPLSNRHRAASSAWESDQPELAQSGYPDLDYQWHPEAPQEFEGETSTHHDGQRVFKPLHRSTNYERMASDAKRRTAQAFDIIQYLLENNGGVFPGDKALFYALTKVFLKEFQKQMPPTWKNCTSAVKALETRKIAIVHTHMLKTERGRLQTCTLLIKTGVDPNGIIPARMKQEMREAYPNIFIPPAFSPTQEELALLQELDRKTTDKEGKPNANGQKFRSRRKIEEIEVFNAPYYTQSAPVVGPRRDPLWIREAEQFYDVYPARKRAAADDGVTGPSQKRAKTKGQRGRRGVDDYDDIPVDPEILGDPFSPSRTGQRDGPSVLEAIKAYSLLPPKLGPRGRRRLSLTSKPLAKLPVNLGRIRNPGLQSLPGSFFGGAAGGAATLQFISPEVVMLDPNTSLEDELNEGERDGPRGWSPSQSSSQGSVGVEELRDVEGAETEEGQEPKKFKFVWPSVLEPSSAGIWPDHSLAFFEHHEGSFTLNGWMPSLQWLQTQNIPHSEKEMVEKQKADKIKLRDWVDRDYARLCSVVNQCAAWEQSRAGTAVSLGVSVAPGSVFINVCGTDTRCYSKTPTVGWSEETQYDLETLPYDDLEDDDYADVIYVEDVPERMANFDEPSPKRQRLLQQKADGAQGRRLQGRPPKLKLAAIKTLREHTAYPRTAEDFLREDGEPLDLSSENVRLAAFIVVTTLLGGVDRVVDWGLMMRLVPDQTISQLRHYWCALKKDRQSTIVSLTEKFRRAFLRGYELGEIPPIDFENVLAYDWKWLIKWTTKLDMAERRTLPSTRKALEETVTVSKFKHGNRPWREAFYHPQRSMFNKFQDATSEALATSVDNISDPPLSVDMVVAMSWTRSLCVTPVESYTADVVLSRRNSLFPLRSKTDITELMIKGVDQLQRQGVISKSSSKWSNGRRWRFNTRVLDAIEKAAQQDKFAQAAQFKRELDRAFRSSAAPKKRVTYITNDGMIMALLNLQAAGRVRVETTGQPHVPMGHEPGNYETRKYTKKYMHFRLDVVPTSTYLFDSPTPSSSEDPSLSNLRARIKSTPPPTRGPGGAVPVWCDVFGRVDADRWLRYLSAVLITLASRGSMRVGELVETLKPVVMEFEAELIVQWAGKLGLLGAPIEGLAPAVREWWWIAVEVQREGLFAGL
ncbi:hypothetical protein C8A05DRAFT_35170 [Staphylotrichum tortipilum]|uniref:Uncharacterized protein n=1 Tax=Staphylotrichum tortipilum TaxID=2831512 RepID=A0AAN6MHV1_9PEZI|nr:hypothetical protein C8A05DRAFT_35170 [Staphylotrichum longicolle]